MTDKPQEIVVPFKSELEATIYADFLADCIKKIDALSVLGLWTPTGALRDLENRIRAAIAQSLLGIEEG